jgi:nitrogen regulatory protein P-II 1
VNEEMVNDVIKTITRNARTGNHGDGKIFIYDVRIVIRIRTREDDERAGRNPEGGEGDEIYP